MGNSDRLRQIYGEIKAFLVAHADAAVATRYVRYFKEGYDPYGIPEQLWRAQTVQWSQQWSDELGLAGLLDLGDLLFASGKYEEGVLAISLVARCRTALDGDAYRRLGRWLEFGVHNWAHADLLCGELLSLCLAEGRVPYTIMDTWRTSPFKYKRRAVPVAMLKLLKKQDDLRPLLDFLRPLMADGERVVQQGLGWFLREAWKVQPQPVEAFLLEWKDTAPRLILQYATEKMAAPEKARFRQERFRKRS